MIYIHINIIVPYFVTWAEQVKRVGDAGMPGVEENDLAKVDDLPAGKWNWRVELKFMALFLCDHILCCCFETDCSYAAQAGLFPVSAS